MARAWGTTLACAVAIALAGCGGGDDRGDSSSPDPAPASNGDPAETGRLGVTLARLRDEDTLGAGPLEGRWSGTLHQADTEPFPITVSINSLADPARNVVHYGGEIACGGTWRFMDGVGSKAFFRETIDRGSGGRCKGSGVVTLTATASANRLAYGFHGGGVSSHGTLTHQGRVTAAP